MINRKIFRQAFPDRRKDANGFVQFVRGHGGLAAHRPRFRQPACRPLMHAHGAGQVCEKRYGFLERALDGGKERHAIVFLHHTPFITGFPGMDDIRLEKADKFFDALRATAMCSLSSPAISTARCPPISAAFRRLCSKARRIRCRWISSRQSSSIACIEPPAYGILLLDDQGVVVHTEDYMWPQVTGESLSA